MIIDSNIFLEFLLNQEKAETCKDFLNKTVRGEIEAITVDFIIDSVVISMKRNNKSLSDIMGFLKKLINSRGIRIYSVSMNDRIEAVKIMGKYNLDYDDSLILQSAMSTNSKEILSFDKHFDKVKEIKRIEP